MSKEGIGGGRGESMKRETAPCHKGMGPMLNFDTEMSKKRVVQYFISNTGLSIFYT
jgi:hypothetical protein